MMLLDVLVVLVYALSHSRKVVLYPSEAHTIGADPQGVEDDVAGAGRS